MRKSRERLRKKDPGWVSVFTVSIQSLQDSDNDVRKSSIADPLEARIEDKALQGLEKIDLDTFKDRHDHIRTVSFLRFSLTGSLVVATMGMREIHLAAGSSPCVRLFHNNRLGTFSIAAEVTPSWDDDNYASTRASNAETSLKRTEAAKDSGAKTTDDPFDGDLCDY